VRAVLTHSEGQEEGRTLFANMRMPLRMCDHSGRNGVTIWEVSGSKIRRRFSVTLYCTYISYFIMCV